jgi:membrane-bound lytic murein transglycosylase B
MIKVILWGLVIAVVLLLAMGSFVGDGISLQANPGTMSPAYKAMYLAAAQTCQGLPAEVLMAIGQIESGHGANDGPSYAGAIGPMQFMPATWVAYGVDGNHDGFADPFDPADAIPSAARLLCADGAGNPKTLMDAVERYNPGDPTYAVAVMEVARGYAKVVPTATVTAPPTPASPSH